VPTGVLKLDKHIAQINIYKTLFITSANVKT